MTRDAIILCLARGLGSGLSPIAPGTAGSAVGLGWFALLLLPRNPLWFSLGSLAGIFAAIWLCGKAEAITGQHDPGSVVLDEIAAIPIAFSGWLVVLLLRTGELPGPGRFFQPAALLGTAGVFLLFRLFDVWKPWPVRQSQGLPGGWGVVADDLLAALYTALPTALLACIL